jgi:hypothetical protein
VASNSEAAAVWVYWGSTVGQTLGVGASWTFCEISSESMAAQLENLESIEALLTTAIVTVEGVTVTGTYRTTVVVVVAQNGEQLAQDESVD